jgi:DNA-binding NarL/FixJ family response regulator
MAWTVGVVEDDPGMREKLERALACDARWSTVFAVGTVAEVRARFSAGLAGPDTLLVDLGLPDGSGLDLISEARRHWPHCECLVISVFGDEERVIRSVEAGAVGYILKGQGDADVIEHLGYLREGGSPMSPAVARHLLRRVAPKAPGRPSSEAASGARTGSVLHDLTHKELEVLRLLARGEPYESVSRHLGVTVNTVRFHVKGLYSKLGVNSRQKAVLEGVRRHLIPAVPQGPVDR